MRTPITMLLAAFTIATVAVTPASADDKKTEAEAGQKKATSAVEAGPRKGRILAVGEPKAEFFVEADKTVSIKFYDKDNKVVAPVTQTVTATVDAGGTKTKLEFEKKGDALVSKAKLPEGNSNPVVVQVKTAEGAKPQNFRFKLDLSNCAECSNPEYACTCEGH